MIVSHLPFTLPLPLAPAPPPPAPASEAVMPPAPAPGSPAASPYWTLVWVWGCNAWQYTVRHGVLLANDRVGATADRMKAG